MKITQSRNQREGKFTGWMAGKFWRNGTKTQKLIRDLEKIELLGWRI